MPNLAPEIEAESLLPSQKLLATASFRPTSSSNNTTIMQSEDILGDGSALVLTGGLKRVAPTVADKPQASGPKKKKYAKEAWPGKRPGFLVGPVA